MPAGFRNAAGVDFDDIFDPYVTGTSPPNTGFRLLSGADLAPRYAPIEYGTKAPDVGHRTSAGLDVSNLWAAFGTARYVTLSDQISRSEGPIGSGDKTATYELNADGRARRCDGTNTLIDLPGQWFAGGGSTSDYECLVTLNSGDAPSGSAMGVWLNLGTTRSWFLFLNDTIDDSLLCSIHVQIRRVSDGEILATANVTISAIVSLV